MADVPNMPNIDIFLTAKNMFEINISMLSDGINLKDRHNTFLPTGEGLFGINFWQLAHEQPSKWGFLLESDKKLTSGQMIRLKRIATKAQQNPFEMASRTDEIQEVVDTPEEKKQDDDPFPVPDDNKDDGGDVEMDQQTGGDDGDNGGGGGGVAIQIEDDEKRDTVSNLDKEICDMFKNVQGLNHIDSVDALKRHLNSTNNAIGMLEDIDKGLFSFIAQHQLPIQLTGTPLQNVGTFAEAFWNDTQGKLNMLSMAKENLDQWENWANNHQLVMGDWRDNAQQMIDEFGNQMNQKLRDYEQEINTKNDQLNTQQTQLNNLQNQEQMSLPTDILHIENQDKQIKDLQTQIGNLQNQLSNPQSLRSDMATIQTQLEQLNKAKSYIDDMNKKMNTNEWWKQEMLNRKDLLWETAMLSNGFSDPNIYGSPDALKNAIMNTAKKAEAPRPANWSQTMNQFGFKGDQFTNPQNFTQWIQQQQQQISDLQNRFNDQDAIFQTFRQQHNLPQVLGKTGKEFATNVSGLLSTWNKVKEFQPLVQDESIKTSPISLLEAVKRDYQNMYDYQRQLTDQYNRLLQYQRNPKSVNMDPFTAAQIALGLTKNEATAVSLWVQDFNKVVESMLEDNFNVDLLARPLINEYMKNMNMLPASEDVNAFDRAIDNLKHIWEYIKEDYPATEPVSMQLHNAWLMTGKEDNTEKTAGFHTALNVIEKTRKKTYDSFSTGKTTRSG